MEIKQRSNMEKASDEAYDKMCRMNNKVLFREIKWDPDYDPHAGDKCNHSWEKTGPFMPYHFVYVCKNCGIDRKSKGIYRNKDGSIYDE